MPLAGSFKSLSSLRSLLIKSVPSNVTLEFLYWLPKAEPNPHPRPTPIPQPPPINSNCETLHQKIGPQIQFQETWLIFRFYLHQDPRNSKACLEKTRLHIRLDDTTREEYFAKKGLVSNVKKQTFFS